MVKQFTGIAMIASILLMQQAVAQDAPAEKPAVQGAAMMEKQPGQVSAAGVVVVRGTITAINAERREVTIKRPKGDEVVVPAGPEVRNFDQIKVGDQVVLRQAQSVIMDLKKTDGKGGIRERSDRESSGVARPGDKPGIAAMHEVHIVADVTAIDAKAHTVTLRGVHGSRTLQVRDPAVLKNVKKGDQVDVVLVEGEALSVEAANAR